MRLQGAISPRVEARLDEMLGHPETCPHGNPIDAETARRRPAGIRAERGRGRPARDDLPDHRGGRGGRRPALVPRGAGADARRARSRSWPARESLDSLTLDGPRGRATLGLRPAALVRVLPGEADPALFHRVPAQASSTMTALARPDRAEPDRPAPHRDGAHGAVQLPVRAPHRRHVHPPPRGHGPGPQHRSPTRRTSSTGCTGSGSHWDEGPEVAGEAARGPYAPYRQMQRLPLYAEAAERLLAADLAYPCYCTPEELDADRKAQEAAKQPPRYVGRCATLTAEERAAREAEGRRRRSASASARASSRFDDLVRGRVEIDVANLGGDFVIVRGDGTPLYHFTVVVDDAAMEISHVIRGEDHLSNTPKHILLFRALGHAGAAVRPPAAHPQPRPDEDEQAQEPDRGRPTTSPRASSARRSSTTSRSSAGRPAPRRRSCRSTRSSSASSSTEVHKGGAVFDRERLEWLNGQWIRRLDPDDLVDRLRPFVEADARRGPDRPAAVGRRAPRAAADHPGAAADPRRDRRPRRLPVGRRARRSTRRCSSRSAGTPRRRARGWPRRARRHRRRRRGRRSRRTSSSRRCGPSPRPAAGRPATCSWRSASRSPAGPPRRRCSTRSSRSAIDADARAPRSRPGV